MKYLIIFSLFLALCSCGENSQNTNGPSSLIDSEELLQTVPTSCYAQEFKDTLEKALPIVIKMKHQMKKSSDFKKGITIGKIISHWPNEPLVYFVENDLFKKILYYEYKTEDIMTCK